jgi:hypothetical protein
MTFRTNHLRLNTTSETDALARQPWGKGYGAGWSGAGIKLVSNAQGGIVEWSRPERNPMLHAALIIGGMFLGGFIGVFCMCLVRANSVCRYLISDGDNCMEVPQEAFEAIKHGVKNAN